MMGLAIAHYILPQVVFINEPIEMNPMYSFDIERMRGTGSDAGEQMVVI